MSQTKGQEPEQVPEEVRSVARAAFAARGDGAAVLDLAHDSLLDDDAPQGPRQLVFGSQRDGSGVAVSVVVDEADEAGGALRLRITSSGCSLEGVRCGGQELAVEGSGPWSAGPGGHGLCSITLSGDGQLLRTAWVRI